MVEHKPVAAPGGEGEGGGGSKPPGGGGEGEGGGGSEPPGGEGEGGGGSTLPGVRGPQSLQSVPTEQKLNSAPAPPSSQSLSEAYEHVSVHCADDCVT